MEFFAELEAWIAAQRQSPLGNALCFFGLFALIYAPLELCFPAHRQRPLRREWGTDLLFFLGQFLLWSVPAAAVLVALITWLDGLSALEGLRAVVASWPLWLQLTVGLFSADVCTYWAHRLSHSVPLLWRFHRVHHTAERLDWLAAYREHPFDNVYTRTFEMLPLLLMGLPLQWLAGFFLFRGFWAIYIHSNVSLSPGPLRYLLGSSRLHHWHHEYESGGRCNFANLSPLMDLMFGTFKDPGHMPQRYGIADPLGRNYFVQLLEPLLPDGLLRRLLPGRRLLRDRGS